MLAATKVLSRQKYACHDKSFVETKLCLSRQNIFVETNSCFSEATIATKEVFVTTKVSFAREMFWHI